MPPLAAKLWEYDTPCVPFGSGEPVVIATGVVISREKFFSSIWVFDVTRTLKLEF